jgi:hypothetical protein
MEQEFLTVFSCVNEGNIPSAGNRCVGYMGRHLPDDTLDA